MVGGSILRGTLFAGEHAALQLTCKHVCRQDLLNDADIRFYDSPASSLEALKNVLRALQTDSEIDQKERDSRCQQAREAFIDADVEVKEKYKVLNDQILETIEQCAPATDAYFLLWQRVAYVACVACV